MGISSQLVKCFDQNFHFDFAANRKFIFSWSLIFPWASFRVSSERLTPLVRTAHSTSLSLLCKIAQAVGRL
jgi:hypothetical protein